MRAFFEEFKKFAMRGNVVDLAVAVVIGGAFGKIVSSLVDNIVTPLIGILLGGINFSGLTFAIGDTAITYGLFIQASFNFVVIAFVVFITIKVMNTVISKEEKKEEKKPKEPSEEVVLLREIRDAVQK